MRSLLAIFFCLIPSYALSQLVTNLTIGNPKALALANSVTADPVGVDSIHFNPAGLALIHSSELNVKLIAGYLDLSWELGARCDQDGRCPDYNLGKQWEAVLENFPGEYPDDPETSARGNTSDIYFITPGGNADSLPFALAPLGGIAFHDPSSTITYATAVYSPEAGGYDRGNQSGGYQGENIGITRITYLAPSIGLQLSDELYLGASLGFSWQGLGLETKLRTPLSTLQLIDTTLEQLGINDLEVISPYDDIGRITIKAEDDIVFSFNLGALWMPTPWQTFGLTYRSESKAILKGNYTIEYSDEFTQMTQSLKDSGIGGLVGLSLTGSAKQKGNVEASYPIPQYLSIGSSTQLTPGIKINIDAKWTDYAILEELNFEFSGTTDFTSVGSLIQPTYADKARLTLPRNYQSVWGWSTGVEYRFNENTVLRSGYEFRPSAAPDQQLDLLLPLGDAELYSIGFGYQLDVYTLIEFGAGYVVTDYKIPPCGSNVANSCSPAALIYNPYPAVELQNTTKAYLFSFGYTTKI